MKRLAFIVEGDSEIILVEKLILPYLVSLGFNIPIHAQTITTNRKQFKKGGVGSFGKYKNEITRTLAQGNVIVTSIIDFFKLPTDFPSFSIDASKITEIESAIHSELGNHPDFIPYIQKHELEALMFSEMSGFDFVIDSNESLEQINQIMISYPNPEDINNSPQTAPSKRLENIFKYKKAFHGDLIFEMMDIKNILEKCPRFASWIEKIVNKLQE
ncbi:DUF4276 family protein [Lacihabitans sp. CCS-44]|uniref:DUF4276 family protein n=1 Tax=Lacihabitans sp. CCS-44 TaxID=2487331 RepID=UPI0020CFAB06|nr:DUF4276 family protein [Lacihabitans sp. CCS-44]MCP9755182.1 DUF4276 family protein [Lacihabitans sp. CCS-44]